MVGKSTVRRGSVRLTVNQRPREAAGGGVRSRPSAGIFQDRGRSSTAVEDTGDQKFYFVHFFQHIQLIVMAQKLLPEIKDKSLKFNIPSVSNYQLFCFSSCIVYVFRKTKMTHNLESVSGFLCLRFFIYICLRFNVVIC